MTKHVNGPPPSRRRPSSVAPVPRVLGLLLLIVLMPGGILLLPALLAMVRWRG